METSASYEARSAPLPYPTTGMKQRMKEPYEKGVGNSRQCCERGICLTQVAPICSVRGWRKNILEI
jgi:hypothetical protein